ncbi:hypothetical protein MPTK1_5g21710 [Marchantia polymorpha subsp. ruderalis]|uniref:Uncharacterized protein n=2 Tax=Marchantia polymorpha TaxID=3197 RepID=A0AAF6BKV5_MARPO|nr:hypothetical protein MARPO_0106s0028 [Marchantia polymorpha]BBN12639.1 hypothetical protein Mp_5g21710 [Marchantia polymorpha subsp. ruderalis]|eukprot:PTQ31832.1 hypothetical protein MARPO_0106s0028 [Marchantia polymorpha]
MPRGQGGAEGNVEGAVHFLRCTIFLADVVHSHHSAGEVSEGAYLGQLVLVGLCGNRGEVEQNAHPCTPARGPAPAPEPRSAAGRSSASPFPGPYKITGGLCDWSR